jgi:hypothetical protein
MQQRNVYRPEDEPDDSMNFEIGYQSDEGTIEGSEVDTDDDWSCFSEDEPDDDDAEPYQIPSDYEIDTKEILLTTEEEHNTRGFTVALDRRVSPPTWNTCDAANDAHLGDTLKSWKMDLACIRRCQDKYMYILQNRCPTEELSVGVPWDSDKTVVQCLHELYPRDGFQVFLGQLKRTQLTWLGYKYDRWEDYGGVKPTLSPKSIVIPKGLAISRSCRISLEDILHDSPFDGTPTRKRELRDLRDPDEGPLMMQTYSHAVRTHLD